MKPVIKSSKNDKIKFLKKLYSSRQRKKSGKFVLEGYRLIKEAIILAADFDMIFMTPSFAADQKGEELIHQLDEQIVYYLSPDLLEELVDTVTPQGVVAVANQPVYEQEFLIRQADNILILDQIQDPGNMGTLIRTAVAAGFDAIISLKGSVDIYNLKVLRSTAGAIFNIPIITSMNLKEFTGFYRQSENRLISADLTGDKYYHQLEYDYPLLLVVGNEAHGIREKILNMSDYIVKIPILNEIDSLNAAVAGALIMYRITLLKNW